MTIVTKNMLDTMSILLILEWFYFLEGAEQEDIILKNTKS